MIIFEILKSVIRGFYVVIGMFRSPSVTVNFPKEDDASLHAEKKEHALMSNEDGTLKCVACRMCENACPAGAIKIKSSDSKEGAAKLLEFEVDYSKCIFCDMCVLACPVESLKRFSCPEIKSKFDRRFLKLNKEKLAENGKKYKIIIESESKRKD